MNIAVNANVSYSVTTVDISALLISKDDSGGIIMRVPYRWIDSNGKVLRQDSTTYVEEYLLAAFRALGGDFSPFNNTIKAMMGEDYSVMNVLLTSGKMIVLLSPKNRASRVRPSKSYTQDEFDVELKKNGANIASIRSAIEALTVNILSS